ncbi:MAG: aldolase/citrate lyase family protein [Gammaproteobacteria bacterium]
MRTIKPMTEARDLKLGHFIVEFATPGIGHIMKNAGCDYALLDTEHSGFGHETMKSALRYIQAADLPAIVRVPSKEYHHIARAADMGADAIMLPMVNNAKEARHILNCMKYPPEGERGAAFGVAHDRYMAGAPLDKMRAANANLALVTQIETADGVKNVDEIAAVAGVDVIWVGHFDLSNSLGIPGQFEHAKFLKAIDAVVNAGRKHNKSVGRLVPDVATGIDYFNKGFDFICYSGDVWALMGAIKAGVDGIRAGCAAAGKPAAAKTTARRTKK